MTVFATRFRDFLLSSVRGDVQNFFYLKLLESLILNISSTFDIICCSLVLFCLDDLRVFGF
jgi:hypothetical protein